VEEVFDLFPIMGESYAGAIFLKGYIPGISDNAVREGVGQEEFVENARALTNVKNLDTEEAYGTPYRISVAIATALIWIYRILNPVLVLYTLYALIRSIVRGIKALRAGEKRLTDNGCKTLGLVLFGGIGLAYSFASAWFSSFLFTEGIDMTVLNFYNIALPGLVGISCLFGLSLKKE
jgi:hypothetical protein